VQRGELRRAKRWTVETGDGSGDEGVTLVSLVSRLDPEPVRPRAHARTHGNGRDPTTETHTTHTETDTSEDGESTSGSDTGDAKTNARTSGSEGYQGVTPEVLAVINDPPDWVQRHLDSVTGDMDEIPWRVASAVSLEAYGTMDRWREVLHQLQELYDVAY
jgi:hypothetical protein